MITRWLILTFLLLCVGEIQIFTNADKIHAVKALSRLGLEDCFEGIICFETLNPIHKDTASDDEDDADFIGSQENSALAATSRNKLGIFDIISHFSHPDPGSELPKTPIVCKPSEHAIERALEIASLSPQRTVRHLPLAHSKHPIRMIKMILSNTLTSFSFPANPSFSSRIAFAMYRQGKGLGFIPCW